MKITMLRMAILSGVTKQVLSACGVNPHTKFFADLMGKGYTPLEVATEWEINGDQTEKKIAIEIEKAWKLYEKLWK